MSEYNKNTNLKPNGVASMTKEKSSQDRNNIYNVMSNFSADMWKATPEDTPENLRNSEVVDDYIRSPSPISSHDVETYELSNSIAWQEQTKGINSSTLGYSDY